MRHVIEVHAPDREYPISQYGAHGITEARREATKFQRKHWMTPGTRVSIVTPTGERIPAYTYQSIEDERNQRCYGA